MKPTIDGIWAATLVVIVLVSLVLLLSGCGAPGGGYYYAPYDGEHSSSDYSHAGRNFSRINPDGTMSLGYRDQFGNEFMLP